MQLLILIKEDCFDKLLTLPLMNLLVVVYVSQTLPTWNQVNWKNDHSLNVLNFHMNKVPTLQNAWAIKIN